MTLIETIISVLIMGIAVVSIAAALGASVRHSTFVEERATVEAEARRIAERIRSFSVPLAECGDPTPYGEQLAATAGRRAEIAELAFWSSASGVYEPYDSATCTSVYLVQRIRVRVVTEDTGVSAVVTIVKREE